MTSKKAILSHKGLLISLALMAIVWEIVGQNELLGHGTFPSLSGICSQLWRDRFDYTAHISATLQIALLGFIFGNLFSISLALMFVLFRPLRLLMGFLTAVFSIPLLLLVPIVSLSFDDTISKIVLASMAVYYQTLVLLLTGLESVDGQLIDVVLASGGGKWMVFRKLRMRASLPALLTGFRVAAPAALLGAMLGEFAGARWGLGVYLLASTAQANPERVWGICVVSAGLAATGYFLFGYIESKLSFTSTTSLRLLTRPNLNRYFNQSVAISCLRALAAFCITLVMWGIIARVFKVPFITKQPIEVFRYLLSLSAEDRSGLLTALRQTLSIGGFGLLVGLAIAFILAVVVFLKAEWSPFVLMPTFISQTVPIVALIPLIVLTFGRGTTTILVVTVLATFFPSFVTIFQGLRSCPKDLIDLTRVYSDSRWPTLFKIQIPSAFPYLLASTRLAIPRVLLGVLLAEYLATRTGLGALFFDARGKLDFGLIWSICAITAAISTVFTHLFQFLESKAFAKYGSQDA